MGRDKALLELGGRPLAELAVEKLRGLGLEVRICGAAPGFAEPLTRFAEVVADRVAGSGPLAGIEAGLAAGDGQQALFMAVDTPLVPAEFLRWMMERAERSGAVATIPVAGGMPQPLCAVYSGVLRAGLRRAIEAGHLKMMRAVSEAAAELGERVDRFDVENVAAALAEGLWPAQPPFRDWFRNLNTPEEWAGVSGELWRRDSRSQRV